MPAFSLQPYSSVGTMGTDPRNMTWFPVSANKIVIVYAATISGGAYWMMQAVTFNGNGAPTFGTPSRVTPATTSTTPFRFPRGCVIAPGRIVLSIPTTMNASNMPSAFTLALVEMDEQDRFRHINNYGGSITLYASTGGCPIEPLGTNTARVFFRASGAASATSFHDITYDQGTDSLSLNTVATLSGPGSSATQVQGHITIKRGLDNGMLLTSCWYGGSIYTRRHFMSASGTQLGNGVASGLSQVQSIMASVPIRDSKSIYMQQSATQYAVYDFASAIKTSTVYRTDGLGTIHMDDSAWLDSTRFATLCVANTVNNLTNNEAATTIRAGAGRLMINEYDEATMTMTPAATFFDMGQNLCARWWQKSIHKISSRTMAIIHPRYDGSNNTFLAVSVLSV